MQYCKHRISIIEGSTANIVSDNLQDIKTVLSWLPGSQLAESLEILRKEESEYEKAKNRVSAAKKNLAKTMRPK